MFHLKNYKVIFWDFDGVIKDSQEAKSNGFLQLFKDYGTSIQAQVVQHHRENGGLSRLEKIPYYFEHFIKESVSQKKITDFCNRFGDLSHEATLASPWVAGVFDYLEENYQTQDFYIATGTPQEEIEITCQRLGITDYFKGIFGAPQTKETTIQGRLREQNYPPQSALMIGDAKKDQAAASYNGIDFLLRDTPENRSLFLEYQGYRVDDFTSFTVAAHRS